MKIFLITILCVIVQVFAAREAVLQANKEILAPLKEFGNAGNLLYSILTEKSILGKEISESSATVDKTVGFEKHKEGFKLFTDILKQVDYQSILPPLIDHVKDIKSPETGETLQEAIDTIVGIFKDQTTFEEFRARLISTDLPGDDENGHHSHGRSRRTKSRS